MLPRVALVRTDVSEEISVSIIRLTRIGELETTLALTSNRRNLRGRLLVTANVVPSSPILVTLKMEALLSSETSVLTRATRRNITDDGFLHSHSRDNLKSYKFMFTFMKINLQIEEQKTEDTNGLFDVRVMCSVMHAPFIY
jgi:hypothetical protein